jgi:SWI/SNF-related matrix-associated actin-dependent regulator 1 of chromatin subfamily A
VKPFPHQIEGALFLANRRNALLADEPRVGKTGAAIMAADYEMAETILVITTSSGRAVWRHAFEQWSPFGRAVQVLDGKKPLDPKTQVAIVSWGAVNQPQTRSTLLHRRWNIVIPDEAHFAKNFEAKRTQALYGTLGRGGVDLDNTHAIAGGQEHIWPLTGTPCPNSPFDLYPHLRALEPWRLEKRDGMPDVMKADDFMHRYCVVRFKKTSQFRKIPVVVGGRNADELRERIKGFWLLRTQKDVGITEPIYETFPLAAQARLLREVNAAIDQTKLGRLRGKKNVTEDDLKAIELELAQIRRLTGTAKAHAVAEAVKEEFDCGLDKIVLAYWHRDVGDLLAHELSSYGVVRLDGSTSASMRGEAEQRFLHDPKVRVFLGQIQAAGEAIDLSSAAELMCVETSIVPKDMSQMSKRITNHTQTRQPRVRVATLDGSVDDALQAILLRKWSAIREVLS